MGLGVSHHEPLVLEVVQGRVIVYRMKDYYCKEGWDETPDLCLPEQEPQELYFVCLFKFYLLFSDKEE